MDRASGFGWKVADSNSASAIQEIIMGMYNEVFIRCPICGHKAYMQIHQIVLGFGGFDLDNRETLERLTQSELHELKAAVMERWFRCEGEGCDNYFNPYRKEEKSAKIDLAEELFKY
jgi:hypothetical protein